MKVLVICEFSGAVRDAFIRAGHDAWSNDILPPEGKYPEKHFMTDDCWRMKWDLIIAHPPCTFLANSGVRWLYGGKGNRRDPVRWKNMEDGAAFFNSIAGLRCKRIVIENPIMHGHARKLIVNWPTQIIQPWMFGHGETKATELHLKGVPPLVPTRIVSGRAHSVHLASPGPDRGKIRGRTFSGIANAMAKQWGNL